MATATEGLVYSGQDDYSAGCFPGMEVIPPNGLEDLVNGLVADDGSCFRRGATAYKSNAAVGASILGLWDGYLVPGRRTLFHTTSNVHTLDTDDATPLNFGFNPDTNVGRWTEVAHLLMRAAQPPNTVVNFWGGARPFTTVTAGTVSVALGSKTVTGAGTAWTGGTVPAGALLVGPSTGRPAVIASVTDGTHLQLAEPWPYEDLSTVPYSIRATQSAPLNDPVVIQNGLLPSYLSSIFGRLVVGNGNRVSFSLFQAYPDPLDLATTLTTPAPLNFLGTDYHSLPDGAVVTGLWPLRDTMLVFSTAGVFGIYNMGLDLVDDFGNPQQRLEQISPDVVLWGDAGLATWRTSVVVPGTSDLFLMGTAGAPEPITGGGRVLYRSYVQAGYRPGQSAVFRGHLFLPILDASNVAVDLLVWRLDMSGPPMVRWAGHARSRVFAVRAAEGAAAPLLLGAGSQRVLRMNDCFAPVGSSPTDADGSTYAFQPVSRALNADGYLSSTWRRFRARMETPGGGTNVTFEYGAGKPASALTLTGNPRTVVKGDEVVYSWTFVKSLRSMRFRLSATGGQCVLRSWSAGIRPSGKHTP